MQNYCLNILEFAAYSLESSDWTAAFEEAVKVLENRGGGTIFVPAGVYPTGSIQLKSHMTLFVDNGAILDFKDYYENYPLVEVEFEGAVGKMYRPLIFAVDAEQVAVLGNGCLNGNGQRAWREMNSLPCKRPYLICFQNCINVRVEQVTLINSPVWTIHPLHCDNVIIHGVTIKNPPDSPNTDGINPNGCNQVRISDCFIDVGDDCIAIKAGTELTPKKRACENITITNCNMIHGHGGIVIGSEMSGSIRNVTVSNCVFQNTDRGIRLKTRRKRGGAIERLNFNNIIMDKVLCPFAFNMYYFCGAGGEERHVWEKTPYEVDEGTPAIRDLLISNIIATEVSAAAGFMYGLAEQFIENVTFSNCRIDMAIDGEAGMPDMLAHQEPMKGAGFFLRNARNIVFQNVSITKVVGKIIDMDDSVELKIQD
ncbi:MAG: glycoside hydrolase family 28 protein [Mobilitalea sp.]